MLISDYLREDCVEVDLDCKTKDEVLNKLVALQFAAHPEVNQQETLSSLYEREALLSTGIGQGIAIPHARIGSCDTIYVSFGTLKNGVDFQSLDNQPVQIVLLILFPKDQVNLQLRFLARVSRVLQNSSLLDELIQCKSSQQVIAVFSEFENKHFH